MNRRVVVRALYDQHRDIEAFIKRREEDGYVRPFFEPFNYVHVPCRKSGRQPGEKPTAEADGDGKKEAARGPDVKGNETEEGRPGLPCTPRKRLKEMNFEREER